MWSIKEVKRTGKEAMNKNYWGCVLAALVLSMLTTGSAMSGSSQALKNLDQLGLSTEEVVAITAVLASAAVVLSLAWTGLRIFVLNPLELGCHAYLKENIEGDVTINRLKAGFESYSRTVITFLLRDVFLALWFLLFFIPGVVKSYSYMMVPYILLDEPELSGMEAITRSRQMMNGHKWKAFLMDLSFIGWMFLALITCGIVGVLYEEPYKRSSKAALYLKLRDSGKPVAENYVENTSPEVLS